ncbi:MAG: DNA-3-methyladenine glycosylase [Bacillota bacterium]
MQFELDFFLQNTAEVARKLIGHYLYRETETGLLSGIIVETEAYLSDNDPACHASRGQTKRNATMFGSPGRAYVYFIYGNYYCLNVVTGPQGKGEAVLIRALEPLTGKEFMYKQRGNHCSEKNLSSGPGKLCQAFAIDKKFDKHDLRSRPLYLLCNDNADKIGPVKATPRIGLSVAKDKLLRFIVEGNNFLSR